MTKKYDMKIAGDFNAYNALAAYTVLRELGLNEQTIKNGFETYTLRILWSYAVL